MERALDSVWMGLNGRLDNVTKREVELMKEADLAAKEGSAPHYCAPNTINTRLIQQ